MVAISRSSSASSLSSSSSSAEHLALLPLSQLPSWCKSLGGCCGVALRSLCTLAAMLVCYCVASRCWLSPGARQHQPLAPAASTATVRTVVQPPCGPCDLSLRTWHVVHVRAWTPRTSVGAGRGMSASWHEQCTQSQPTERGVRSRRTADARARRDHQRPARRHRFIRFNPLPPPGNVVGAVHARRGTRAAARGAPGAAW